MKIFGSKCSHQILGQQWRFGHFVHPAAIVAQGLNQAPHHLVMAVNLA